MRNANEFILDRLYNANHTAEGPNLPPRVIGDSRVPVVTGLKIALVEQILGGTQFTLLFDEPEYSDEFINGYDVYVVGLDGIQTPQGPYSTPGSPTILRLVTATANPVTFIVQTVLNNGLASPLDLSPACSSFTFAVNEDARLLTDVTDKGTSGAVETLLHIYTLPANYLRHTGDAIEITASGTFTPVVSNKRLRVYLGATPVFDSGSLAISAAVSYRVNTQIFRTDALAQSASQPSLYPA